MDIYSLIQTHVVSQMTPVITLTSIETIAGTPVKYKLFSCNTQWITINDKITIDGVVYKVVSFVQDEYLIVTGASAPVQLYFQLTAPTFEHGTHRRVSSERVKKSASKRTITPMIYALPVKGKTRPSIDSMYGFSGKVRFFCLTTFDKNGDATIATQQTNVVNPMSALAKYFIQKFEERLDLFEEIQEVFQDDFMDFGDPAIWGAKERIFEEFLSGVGVNFDLNIYSQDECCTDTPAVSCLPVKFQIEGVLAETLPSGDTFNLNLIDTDGNVPTHTYDPVTDTLEVPAPGGGGSIDVAVNGTPFYSSVSTNQNLPVKKSDTVTNIGSKVGPNWIIGDTSETYNGNAITGVTAEGFKDIVGKDSAGNDVGTVTADTESELEITIANSTVSNSDDTYTAPVLAEGSLELPDIIVTDSDGSSSSFPSAKNVVCTPSINTSNPFKTGQTTSYVANDDGDLERGNGVDFYTLSHNNYFGNTNRFTDDLGGQTYTSGWVIDWATWNQITGDFIMWYMTYQASATWTNAMVAQPYTRGSYADCYIPNESELYNLLNRGVSPSTNYAPFNLNVTAANNGLWTSTTVPNNTAAAYYFAGSAANNTITGSAKTANQRFILMRYGNISEL